MPRYQHVNSQYQYQQDYMILDTQFDTNLIRKKKMNPCTLNINYLLNKLLSCEHLFKNISIIFCWQDVRRLLIILQIYYEV